MGKCDDLCAKMFKHFLLSVSNSHLHSPNSTRNINNRVWNMIFCTWLWWFLGFHLKLKGIQTCHGQNIVIPYPDRMHSHKEDSINNHSVRFQDIYINPSKQNWLVVYLPIRKISVRQSGYDIPKSYGKISQSCSRKTTNITINRYKSFIDPSSFHYKSP